MPNPAQEESDGDIFGDACDPCHDPLGMREIHGKPVLVVRRINTDLELGNDGLLIRGDFIRVSAFAALEPHVHGARVVLANAAGEVLVDVRLAAGLYAGRGTRGWKAAGSPVRSWTYVDTTSRPGAGIVHVAFVDRDKVSPLRTHFVVRGQNGAFPVAAGDEPLKAIVVPGGDAASVAGDCGETAFTEEGCVFNRKKNTIVCRR